MKDDGTRKPAQKKQFEELTASIRQQQLVDIAHDEPEKDDVDYREFLKIYREGNPFDIDDSFVGKALGLLVYVNTWYMLEPDDHMNKEAVGHALNNMSMAIVEDKPKDKSTLDRFYAIFHTNFQALEAHFWHFGVLPHDKLWALVAHFQTRLSQYVHGGSDE